MGDQQQFSHLCDQFSLIHQHSVASSPHTRTVSTANTAFGIFLLLCFAGACKACRSFHVFLGLTHGRRLWGSRHVSSDPVQTSPYIAVAFTISQLSKKTCSIHIAQFGGHKPSPSFHESTDSLQEQSGYYFFGSRSWCLLSWMFLCVPSSLRKKKIPLHLMIAKFFHAPRGGSLKICFGLKLLDSFCE